MGKPARRERAGRGAGRGSGESGRAAASLAPAGGLGGVLTLNKDGQGEEFHGDESSVLSPILKSTILGLVCLMSFCIRLFAVVRWESVIHEFDPYFNYRTTKFLSNEGFYSFLNWFDDRGWYPLGRIIGGTIYPGLMVTAATVHGALNALNININVRNMCVFLAPLFAANTALATYLLMKETTKRSSTALLAAAFVGIVPSYISRSVAGSYDNEGVAIFALIFTFYLWVKAVNTGRLTWGAAAAVGYFYMVAAWGGYVFIINIIPIYVVVMIVAGRYSRRLYIAYSTFYVLGSLMAMQVPFVGFNVIKQAECAASHGVFVLLQAYAFATYLRSHLSSKAWKRLAYVVLVGVAGGAAGLLLCLQLFGFTKWTGRSLSLLDPTYAKKYIPIISSVSEHQPTSWTSFFFDLHICVPFAPVGLFFLFRRVTDAKIFLILYGTISWYFAGVMVRLMLTLAPVACMLAAVGISGVFNRFMGHLHIAINDDSEEATSGKAKPAAAEPSRRAKPTAKPFPAALSLVVVAGATLLLCFYALHATYVSSEAYSSPSIVLATHRGDGTKVILDDFREAYYWLRQNTDPNAKIMSWWDYGYQMSSMANRTVLVDNNTWNNTHIATVGRAMASSEEKAYPILQSLDVDYVLAIFGGMTGYQSDDINKFLWMVRIGGGVYPDEIQEPNYFSKDGQYTMGASGSKTMHNCLMYKMCYYRFDELATDLSRPKGFDRARNLEIGHKGFELETLSEAFTSEHWIVRIYKVKKPTNTDATESAVARRQKRRKKSRKQKKYRAKAADKDDEPEPRFVGCYTDENAFGSDRVYGGGSTGSNIGLAKHHARSQKKRYFAVARSGDGNYGHAFAFNQPLTRPDSNPKGVGCTRPCVDDARKVCGCSDDYCGEPKPEGQEFNRRWAVYEMASKKGQSSSKGAAKSAGKKGKKGKGKGKKSSGKKKRRS